MKPGTERNQLGRAPVFNSSVSSVLKWLLSSLTIVLYHSLCQLIMLYSCSQQSKLHCKVFR